jgi:hypothetical protein
VNQILAIALTLLLAGCASAPTLPRAAGSVAQVNLITGPVGLNVDQRPGADAFSAKVYLNDARNPKTIPVREGTLEILMFDGTFFGRTNLPAPLRIWSFDAETLSRQHQVKSSIGIGYDFLLPWGTNRPQQRLITVVARYTSPERTILVSDPSSVTVLEK